ncbi:MAG: polysaccharide pyruvyl transferase family protein [Wenzhouxiangellaceae bacterium]
MTTRNHSLLARLVRIPVKAARTISVRAADDVVLVHWANRRIIGRNWGDKLNPVLCRMLSGFNVVHCYDVFPAVRKPVYYVVGSSLERAQKRRGVVWGAGFIDSGQGIRQAPGAVHAVRGHHSREKLRGLGVDCPETVGDPALLMPRLYTPKKRRRRYRLGVIAHAYERDLDCIAPAKLPDDVLDIDITGGIFDVIDQVAACDEVLSSSLHGLVCAESYGVPSRWVQLSSRPAGDGFKFHDFYSAIGKRGGTPPAVESAADWSRLAGTSAAPVARDKLDGITRDLLAACPITPRNR